jgi:hypothetical protein
MPTDAELSKLQEEWVRYIMRPESENGALLAVDMGLGKTRTAAKLIEQMNTRCVLIVVPLQTIDSWIETLNEQVPRMMVRHIENSKPGKDALNAFTWRVSGIYVIGHEYWERLAWKKQLKKKRRKDEEDKYEKVDSGQWKGDNFLFIFDESHRSANWDNWTNKALMNLDPKVFKVSLSGTFMGDKFDGAFGATRWIWPERTDIIPSNIFAWRKKWADTKYDKFAPRNEKTVGELVEGAFVSSLPCYIRVESDLPKPIVKNVWLDLGDEQRRVYDELDDMMVAWIEDHPLVTEISIVKRARQRQVTLAFPELTFVEDEDDEEYGALLSVNFSEDADSTKIDEIIRDLEGKGSLGDLMVGEQVLFGTDSQKFARLLTKRLNDLYGENTAREWSGAITHPQRKKIKQQFIDGEIKHLVGVQAAMGTGTDGLQAASHIAATVSRADRRITNEQFVGRLNRKGQSKQVYDVRYLARDTIDTGQLSAQMEAALAANRQMRAKLKRERLGIPTNG